MEKFLSEVLALKNKFGKIYIYGAGLYGQNIYKILKKDNIFIDGFIVTNRNSETKLFGLPIYEAKDIVNKEIGIIIGVNRRNVVAIKETLQRMEYDISSIVLGNKFIEGGGIRGGYDGIPTIEITTKIGCSVNCKYCPQNLLVSTYYQNNPQRETYMSVDTFVQCLNKLPKNCTILFSGMAEPFLNKKCIEMIKIACDSGRKVDLYTTLVGASEKDIDDICRLPLEYITLHLADKLTYANIPVSEVYYSSIERLINYKKNNGARLIDVCNAQTEVDERLQRICSGKYHVLTTMLDRAGNLRADNLFKRKGLTGSLTCSICGNLLNHNILLPDGTLLLCCMDYGMKHVLGNLKNETYEDIMNSKELKYVKDGMAGNEMIDILCRNCSCANQG